MSVKETERLFKHVFGMSIDDCLDQYKENEKIVSMSVDRHPKEDKPLMTTLSVKVTLAGE